MDGASRQQRERTRSPVRPREPTPDLENVIPINERKRRQTMWDIKPRGYEAVSAEQAKMSGLFPLPGAPREKGPVDEEKLKEFVEKGALVLKPPDLLPATSRHARRLVVSNLPPLIEDNTLVNFFNDVLYNINLGDGKLTPCVSAHIGTERTLALVEFRTNEEATCALALDGVAFEDVKLVIKRPQDYIVPALELQDTTMHGNGTEILSHIVPDNADKMMIRGLPLELNDEQCVELLKSFGDLRSFILIKDITTEQSKGFAFCQFQDASITDIACEGLHGMELGDSALSVSRACIGDIQRLGEGPGLQAITDLVDSSQELGPTNVLALYNMILPEEVNDDQEYREICEDIETECAKFGQVRDIKIPRAPNSSRVPPGVGKIFVRYEDLKSCSKALQALAGRRFADRTVLTSYYLEENYEIEAF